MLKYPVYIPSKGRSDKCNTAKLLSENKINFLVVVEPQDYKDYRKVFEKNQLLKLDKNDKGMYYVRNFCLAHAKENGYKAAWQLDDDIVRFKKRKATKNIVSTPFDVMRKLENIFGEYKNLAMIGPRYDTFAFAQKKKFSINTNPVTAMLLRTGLPVKFRKGTVEDTDFALQVLSTNKWTTLIANRLLIQVPSFNKQTGGLTESSASMPARSARRIQFAKDWPEFYSTREDESGFIKLVSKRGWSRFKQNLVEK